MAAHAIIWAFIRHLYPNITNGGALMSTEFFLRIIFMFILGIAGGIWGYDLAELNPADSHPVHCLGSPWWAPWPA